MPRSHQNASICIVYEHESKVEQARQFALENELPSFSEKNNAYALQLIYGEKIIELFDTELNTSIFVDFVDGALAHRQQFGGGRGQAIAKAIGLKHGNTPNVLDVTAGLARDAYILATLGCKVTLVEQSPVLYTLVRDGIERAVASDENHLATNFIDLINADSKSYIESSQQTVLPDVIYIDPMYPERKKTALVKKDMQVLQHLLGKDENAEALLESALSHAGKRVVVKRPIHADPVSNIKPSLEISSKKTRYDIYIPGK